MVRGGKLCRKSTVFPKCGSEGEKDCRRGHRRSVTSPKVTFRHPVMYDLITITHLWHFTKLGINGEVVSEINHLSLRYLRLSVTANGNRRKRKKKGGGSPLRSRRVKRGPDRKWESVAVYGWEWGCTIRHAGVLSLRIFLRICDPDVGSADWRRKDGRVEGGVTATEVIVDAAPGCIWVVGLQPKGDPDFPVSGYIVSLL